MFIFLHLPLHYRTSKTIFTAKLQQPHFKGSSTSTHGTKKILKFYQFEGLRRSTVFTSKLSHAVLTSVSDPYHFDADPDPDPRIRFRDDGSGSGSGYGSGTNSHFFFLNFFCIGLKLITMFFFVVILSLLFAYIKQN